MRKGFFGLDDAIAIALIGLVAAVVTVIFEKETNNSITNIIYSDNNTSECRKTNE